MKHIEKLDIYFGAKQVGTLALYKNLTVVFEYSDAWLQNGFSIDPINLPLSNKLYFSKLHPFDGLFGVFNDSLPDGWGLLLLTRMLKKHRMSFEELNPLDKLSIIGNSGMGALEYKPNQNFSNNNSLKTIEEIALDSIKIFETETFENLDDVFIFAGSSGGARPKALIKIDNEDWIVKFPCSMDTKDIALQEYAYCKCAEKCEIEIPEVKLLSSKNFGNFFAIKRFDRKHKKNSFEKIHKISASSILNVSHRIPAIDYNNLFDATWVITKNIDEVKKVFKLMCFNVFAHNRDDHSNNFSFIFDDNCWHFAPAYDLTFSNSLNGEHATTINGEGKNPGLDNILEVAKNFSLNTRWAKDTALSIKNIVKKDLQKWI